MRSTIRAYWTAWTAVGVWLLSPERYVRPPIASSWPFRSSTSATVTMSTGSRRSNSSSIALKIVPVRRAGRSRPARRNSATSTIASRSIRTEPSTDCSASMLWGGRRSIMSAGALVVRRDRSSRHDPGQESTNSWLRPTRCPRTSAVCEQMDVETWISHPHRGAGAAAPAALSRGGGSPRSACPGSGRRRSTAAGSWRWPAAGGPGPAPCRRSSA